MPRRKPPLISFTRRDTFEEVEARIDQIAGLDEGEALTVHLPANIGRNVLQDTWAAIAVGTALAGREGATTRLRGLSPGHSYDRFQLATKSPGLVAAFLSSSVVLDDGKTEVDFSGVREWIEQSGQGTIEADVRNADRLIVEFDQMRAGCLKPSPSSTREVSEDSFLKLIDRYRAGFSFWDNSVRKSQDAMLAESELSKFFYELFENAYRYGRDVPPELRFIRIRKIPGARSQDYKAVEMSFPPAADYARKALVGKKIDTLIEVSISDFGLGILDKFLLSGTGRRYRNSDRLGVLEKILYTDLSSNAADPAAGKGIQNALRAACKLRAFVSLRTAEFTFYKSFASELSSGVEMERFVREPGLSPVRGTHWQFIWASPV